MEYPRGLNKHSHSVMIDPEFVSPHPEPHRLQILDQDFDSMIGWGVKCATGFHKYIVDH